VTSSDAFEQLQRLAKQSVHSRDSTPETPIFRCQATELLRASEPVGWWDVRSFVHEFTGGNVGLWRFVRTMTRIAVEEIGRRLGLLSSYPFEPHEMTGRTSPRQAPQGLRPGELVQIRPRKEIAQTLDEKGKNRGLWFDREMQVYCGHTARVKTKVERFIDERTGRFVELASDCYILEDVICRSDRSEGRWFCPRAIYPWWRESWLRPVDRSPADTSHEARTG
jgi:hypothetical protein